jgi:hypothetical protein
VRLAMYDVLYLDQLSNWKLLASGLNKESAAEVARVEARRRHVGRMFLTGSASMPRSHAVVVIRSGP